MNKNVILRTYASNLKSPQSIFIIISMVVTLAITLLAAHYDWGYRSAFMLAIGMFAVLSGFAFITSDHYLKRLLLFGIITGFTELIADKFLVENFQSLVYPADEQKIWCSPNYMPFAWAVLAPAHGERRD